MKIFIYNFIFIFFIFPRIALSAESSFDTVAIPKTMVCLAKILISEKEKNSMEDPVTDKRASIKRKKPLTANDLEILRSHLHQAAVCKLKDKDMIQENTILLDSSLYSDPVDLEKILVTLDMTQLLQLRDYVAPPPEKEGLFSRTKEFVLNLARRTPTETEENSDLPDSLIEDFKKMVFRQQPE